MANHSGTISSNETWALADSPHHVTGNIDINGGTVTIEAGCSVVFDGNYDIDITQGAISAVGTSANKITFTSGQGSPSKGDWNEIDFNGCQTVASEMAHCIIEYATRGLYMRGTTTEAVSLSDIEIRECTGVLLIKDTSLNSLAGIFAHDCTNGIVAWYNMTISNCIVADINNNGIEPNFGSGQTCLIKNCTVHSCTNGVIDGVGGSSNVVNIRNSIFTDNSKALYELDSGCNMTSTYSCFYNNTNNHYSGATSSTGDITSNPLYANANPSTEDDYRLQSTYGRWNGSTWTTDAADSPCISTGAPGDDYSNEAYSSQINMGFEGNTAYASYDTSPVINEIDDIDNDFRMIKLWSLDDIDCDFRMIGTETTYDIDNDFRIKGAELEDVTNDIRIINSTDTTELIDFSNKFIMVEEELSDINNKFTTVEEELNDINNDFIMVDEELEDIVNDVRTGNRVLSDIDSDIRTRSLILNNFENDFRLITSWQKPSGTEFESSGRTAVRVYFDDVEQTDVDVESISITQNINRPHTADLTLARVYDGTVPSTETVVKIKYNDVLLYQGYITSTLPTDDKEHIDIKCQDQYWYDNKTKLYFFVGHVPTDNKEVYYSTPKDAITSEFSWTSIYPSPKNGSYVGDFVPQTMDCFGKGTSDTLTQLITNSGNYGWYWDKSTTKRLWKAGGGVIVNLHAQELDTNLKLYDVLKHEFTTSIDNITNRLRVQMGDEVIRKYSSGKNTTKTYTGYRYTEEYISPQAGWDKTYERLTTQGDYEHGYDYHPAYYAYLYSNVYKKYTISSLDAEVAKWTDRYPPAVIVFKSSGSFDYIYGVPPETETIDRFSGDYWKLLEGFSIDYDKETLTFNMPMYWYNLNTYGGIKAMRRPNLKLHLWKKQYYSYTETESEDPEADITNSLMFFTDKMGDYAETIYGVLNLSGLTVQEGGNYYDESGDVVIIPSWDDTNFAEDFADWSLSQTCDEKVTGSIDLTIDAMVYYNINLSKRINIDNVLDSSVNIKSINYNFSNFTATLTLESMREYTRTVSLPARG